MRLWPLVFATVFVWKFFHLRPHGIYLIPGLAFTLMLIRFHAVEAERGGDRSSDDEASWRSTAIEACGLTSYPMYLFHAPLMMFVGSLIMRGDLISDWRITWALLVALGLGTGVPLGWLVERPLMEWRGAMLRRLKQAEMRGVPSRPSFSAGSRT